MVGRFYNWLHGKWPAGLVEKLPEVGEDGATNLSKVRIVGDLSGVPLLKFSSDTGAKAVHAILREAEFQARAESKEEARYDLVIIGAGIAGLSAAIEAQKAGLRYVLYESNQAFHTIENFPAGKPIYTYPTAMVPAGGLQYRAEAKTKESLLKDLSEQLAAAEVEVTPAEITHLEQRRDEVRIHRKDGKVDRARRCIVAIGRSGQYRKLDVPGAESGKVLNRLHDPAEYKGKKVMVVGGGDSAVEAALALHARGAEVVLSYRQRELTRPKEANLSALSKATHQEGFMLKLGSELKEITPDAVGLTTGGKEETLPNEVVFSMIGREAPLRFLRRSGLAVRADRSLKWWVTALCSAFFFLVLYQWKKGGTWLQIHEFWRERGFFPFGLEERWSSLGPAFREPAHLLGTMQRVVGDPGFWYSLAYCLLIVVFGLRRIQRRKTPYVKRQTLSLALIQIVPLFLLPYLLLPWAGFNGAFDAGAGKWLADQLFPVVDYGSGREYWRAFGFILAWPLFFWNVFTEEPMVLWLAISVVQTFVVIPLIVRRWGKGAYCGWICSCGALAETLGDAHRHKMPHGPGWNKLNMIGQVFLGLALLIFVFRLLAWMSVPGFRELYATLLYGQAEGGLTQPWSYVWFVDLLWAGVIGVAFYFHLSGRVWCRFACPLAALMHLYARLSRFRIFADKKKCISCNVCTSVCHQGIDVMNFANRGEPMADPQCVRCSACVQQCPTGVLQFGRLGKEGNPVLDGLAASKVHLTEKEG